MEKFNEQFFFIFEKNFLSTSENFTVSGDKFFHPPINFEKLHIRWNTSVCLRILSTLVVAIGDNFSEIAGYVLYKIVGKTLEKYIFIIETKYIFIYKSFPYYECYLNAIQPYTERYLKEDLQCIRH